MDFIFSGGLKVSIGNERKEISLENLATFPPFLRFDKVLLQYDTRSFSSLLTKCLLFEDCLNSIKSALKDSNEICFDAKIDQADPSHFRDHSSVITYLHDRLLPICNSSRRYVFSIAFVSDKNSTTEAISSILQISQVRRCSNVSFIIWSWQSTRLPAEDISNWLVPKTDEGVKICANKGKNRLLQIFSFSNTIPNAQEMWDHLREVNFVYKLAVNLSNNKVVIVYYCCYCNM